LAVSYIINICTIIDAWRAKHKEMMFLSRIITCSLSEMKHYDADIKYFIVQSPGKVKVYGMKHRPDLAPSQELFSWTLENKSNVNWFEEYKNRFCYDIIYRAGLRDAISEVESKSQSSVIMLVCFCADVNQCHRGLIADELTKRGVHVERY